MEISLVRTFGWSLRDIDETDIETLLPFIFRLSMPKETQIPSGRQQVYCDQVSWLN